MLARHAGVPAARVPVVLDLVDLTDRAGDRYATYSLGMKQRLGVAAALLKDPQLLVLDEPTNGLDPAGMADMRMLIRRLGAAGCTVLLSSHLLGEVQQICDRVGVISRGRLVAESTVADLRGAAGLRVVATPLDAAAERVRALVGAGQGRGCTTAGWTSPSRRTGPRGSTPSWSTPAWRSASCGRWSATWSRCSSN